MSFLARTSRATNRSAGLPALDRSHPLASGLAMYVPMQHGAGVPVDLTHQPAAISLNSGAAWGTTVFGSGITLDGANDYIDYGLAPKVTFTQAQSWTIFGVGTVAGGNATHRNFVRSDVGGGGGDRTVLLFRVNNSNVLQYRNGNTSGQLSDINGSTSISADGAVRTFCAVRDAAGPTVTLYLDGVQEVSATDDYINNFTLTGNFQTRFEGGPDEWWNGTQHLLAMWNRPLRADEVKLMHAAPFALLNQRAFPVQRFAATAAAGGRGSLLAEYGGRLAF